jgi:hypothetical protein
MPGRRNRQDLSVSLFPFLSVLACVIGTLTLLIAILALSQMASGVASEPDELNEGTRLAGLVPSGPTMDVESWVDKISALSAKLGDALQTERQLSALRKELTRYGVPEDASLAELEGSIDEQLEEEALRKRKLEVERELRELGTALEVAVSDLASQQEVPDDAPVLILPRGSRDALAPFFVECRQAGIRIFKKDGTWSEVMNLQDLVERGRFKVFLEKVRSIRNSSTVFLIRPRGVETYRHAQALAEGAYARHAKLPIPGDGEIIFRLSSESKTPGAES